MRKFKTQNYDDRPNCDISVLVMHYTGMHTAQDAIKRLCDPDCKVSSHYVIDEDGEIYKLVDESKRAWHAGISCWKGRSLVNDFSIGIEIVNPGHDLGYHLFPKVQTESVIKLSQEIIARYGITADNVVGHSDIAPQRKKDPGELFDWKMLATNGVGLWPEVPKSKKNKEPVFLPGTVSEDVKIFQQKLFDYGYHIRIDGVYGPRSEEVIIAFKRHFIQNNVNSIWDVECELKIDRLLEMMKSLSIQT